jgi:hypothetical protein
MLIYKQTQEIRKTKMQEARYISDFSAIGRLNSFKERVDEMFTAIGKVAEIDFVQEAKDAIKYKKVGGLNFIKVGRVSASWSVKKKAAAPVIVAPIVATPVELEADRARLAARIERIRAR